MYSDDYLYHYGVLGMRWGHRKQRASTGRFNPTKRVKSKIKNYKRNKARRRKAEDLSRYSNKELRTMIERARLEKEYRELKVTNKSLVSELSRKGADRALNSAFVIGQKLIEKKLGLTKEKKKN